MRKIMPAVFSFLISMCSTLAGAALKDSTGALLDCRAMEKQDTVNVVGFWSNYGIAEGAEHEYGFELALFQVGDTYGGWLEDFFGSVGDGGRVFALRDIKFDKKKGQLNFNILFDDPIGSTGLFPRRVKFERTKAILHIDQYSSETLEPSPGYSNGQDMREAYRKRALKCNEK